MATVGRPTPPIIVSASEQGLIAQAVLCAVAGPAQISSSSFTYLTASTTPMPMPGYS